MGQDVGAELKSWVVKEAQQGKYDECDPQTYKRIVKLCGFSKKDRVLDVGCGCGGLTMHIPNAVGLDLSPELIRVARKRSRRKFVVGNLEKLPFADNSFDYVVCFGVLHHFPSIDKVAREMKRVARIGIFLFEPNQHNPHMALIMEPKSPLRYDKLTPNERSLSTKELLHYFSGSKISYFSLRKNVSYNFYYNHIGFVLVNMKSLPKRILGILVLNLVHLYQVFAPEKRRLPFLFVRWRK